VTEADLKDKAAENTARASMMLGGAQYDAYLGSLRSRADVEIRPEALEKK